MEPKKITIDNSVYVCDPLDPHSAIEWGNRMLAVLGPAMMENNFSNWNVPGATSLMHDAIGRCWTPKNEKLSDRAVFNTWFQENPGDLFELGTKAAFEVARDFLPRQLATGLKNFREPEAEAGQ